jgi:cellulose synthase operon protein C
MGMRMRLWHAMIRLLAGCFAVGWFGLAVAPIRGGDKCQAVLDGLRDPKREMYDLALDYLEAMRTSPMADKAFQETIDCQVGITLLLGNASLPPDEREKRLDEARGYLQKFLADHEQHALAASAKRYLATILIEQAQVKTQRSRQAELSAVEKQRLLDDARSLLQEAQQSLSALDTQIGKRLKGYKSVKKEDVTAIAARERLQNEAILTRLALAGILYAQSQTYEPGSKQWREQLASAAAEFSKYYWLYNKWLGCGDFRLREALCYKELGQYTRALQVLDELAAPQPDDNEVARRFRTTATAMALQIDLLPQVKRYQEACDTYEKWEMSSERPGESINLVHVIKYRGGEAALEYARLLDAGDEIESGRRKDYLARAKDLLTAAANSSGEYRLRARVKLTDPLLVIGASFGEAAKGYAEARDLAGIAWDQLQQSRLKPEQVRQLRAAALRYYRFALAHAPRDVKIEQLNLIRFRLEYLNWLEGDCYDAVVLGEFLARRYTDRPEAQAGAHVALYAYLRLCGEAGVGDDRRLENTRLSALAQFVAQRWPHTAAADDAWMVLARAAALNQDLETTLECLDHVAADSPQRGKAELVAGQALWQACLDAARLPEERQPTQTKMTAMISQSRKLLEDGVRRLRKPVDDGKEAPFELAAASLALAQICLETGDGPKAIAWLNDPKLGPQTLVNKAGSQVADRGNLRVDTLKTTLRAWVATQQLEKADATLTALEQAAGNTANLTRIYLSLGRQLEESLKRIRAEGNETEAAKVARGFDFFLTRVADRPAAATSFASLYWVAETFMNLGSSMDPGSGKPPDEAAEYYQKAAAAYRKIIEACRANPQFAPQPGLMAGIQIRLARCLRRLARYQEALDTLVEVLKARGARIDPAVVEAQREAANVYQAWGETAPENYVRAMHGGHPVRRQDGEVVNLIWGWALLSLKVQPHKPFQDVFHEARYNLAQCRLNWALGKADDEKANLLALAEQDVLNVQRLDPQVGGRKWYDKYDALLRKIQQFRGMKDDQQGLKAAEGRLSAAK